MHSSETVQRSWGAHSPLRRWPSAFFLGPSSLLDRHRLHVEGHREGESFQVTANLHYAIQFSPLICCAIAAGCSCSPLTPSRFIFFCVFTLTASMVAGWKLLLVLSQKESTKGELMKKSKLLQPPPILHTTQKLEHPPADESPQLEGMGTP